MQFKTKLLLALVAANAFAWSPSASANTSLDAANEQLRAIYNEDAISAHAVCAAWNGVVGVMLPDDAPRDAWDAILAEGRRHTGKVIAVYGKNLSIEFLEQLMEEVQTEYNAKRVSWADLVTGAQACVVIGL